MVITKRIEVENYIEITINDGINDYMHLVNYENKELISSDNVNITMYAEIVKNCVLEMYYYKCVNMISYRKRSINYITKYLNIALKDIRYTSHIVERLKNIKYLDDRNYAKSYISDMIFLNRFGPNKIVAVLTKDNIDEDIIGEEILIYNNDLLQNNIDYFVSKYLKSNKDSFLMFKDKTINKLLIKGYNLEHIEEYFKYNNIIIDETALVLEKMNKYCGEKRKLIDKLIKKGFNSDIVISTIMENYDKKNLI